MAVSEVLPPAPKGLPGKGSRRIRKLNPLRSNSSVTETHGETEWPWDRGPRGRKLSPRKGPPDSPGSSHFGFLEMRHKLGAVPWNEAKRVGGTWEGRRFQGRCWWWRLLRASGSFPALLKGIGCFVQLAAQIGVRGPRRRVRVAFSEEAHASPSLSSCPWGETSRGGKHRCGKRGVSAALSRSRALSPL